MNHSDHLLDSLKSAWKYPVQDNPARSPLKQNAALFTKRGVLCFYAVEEGQNRAHFLFVDPYNFSFFEDKPQESETDPPKASSSLSSDTPEGGTKPDDDPFGFDAFDINESETQTDDLGFATAAPAPVAVPETDDDFDLSSLSSGFSASGPGSSDGFPSLAFAPAPSTPEDSIDMGFDDIRVENESTTDPFADLTFSPESSEAMAAEASEALTLNSDDSFDLAQLEPPPATEPEVPAAPEAPIESQPAELPEVATVLPPVDASDIRASVVPAVFLSPAPVAPAPSVKEEEFEETLPVPAPELREESPLPSTPTETARGERDRQRSPRFLTTDDPYGEVAPPRERLRVAILGASGIGKNHARWFARHSCDIVSFLGSSNESVELTRSHLEAHMGFSGKGYSDLGRLLTETQPQAVCIASPSSLHYAQAMQCLEAGIHVLCEKPLVYSPTRSKRENSDGARELLKAAAKRNLVLATQLQYGTATPILSRLAGVSPFEVGDFAMEIETTNPKSPRDPKELWIELAPHPLSVAQYLAGDGAEIVQETLQIIPSRSAYNTEVTARFGVRCDGGRLLMCRVIARWFDKIVDNRDPRRRFSFNGRVVQYSGVKSPDGTYIAQYVAPDGYISHYSDPVDYLIGNFVRTCCEEDQLIFSAEQGVQNLDWLLATAEKL